MLCSQGGGNATSNNFSRKRNAMQFFHSIVVCVFKFSMEKGKSIDCTLLLSGLKLPTVVQYDDIKRSKRCQPAFKLGIPQRERQEPRRFQFKPHRSFQNFAQYSIYEHSFVNGGNNWANQLTTTNQWSRLNTVHESYPWIQVLISVYVDVLI